MAKLAALFYLLVFYCGCASRDTQVDADDFLSDALNHPRTYTAAEIPSRYWVFGNFLVHFVTNANEKNKNLPPTFYIHGLGASLDGYSEMIKENHPSAASRPYYAIDLPPFGKSAIQTSELTIRKYTEMLQEFVAMLNVPKVNLVCHSMGGQVCIDFALSNPNQVNLLTLISPAGIYEKSAFVNDATKHFAGINVGPVSHPGGRSFGDMSWYDQDFTRRVITNNPMILIAVESFRSNFHDRIQRLKTKTLIIWGREDKIFSFENGLFLKENVENSTLYIIDGAGHTPMKSHASQISRLIQKYL